MGGMYWLIGKRKHMLFRCLLAFRCCVSLKSAGGMGRKSEILGKLIRKFQREMDKAEIVAGKKYIAEGRKKRVGSIAAGRILEPQQLMFRNRGKLQDFEKTRDQQIRE